MTNSNTSDSPPPDLKRQRDEFLQNFTQGARLTEEFVREYDRVNARVRELEAENGLLRARIEEEDVLREMLQKITALEQEKRDLLSRFEKAEAASSAFSERFEEVENEFANLANLFVASNQLHSTLTPRRVVRRIKEVMAQLVGAERYAVYMRSPERTELVPIAWEGVEAGVLGPVASDDERFRDVTASGKAQVPEGAPTQGSVEQPAAVLPLTVDEESVGAIAIFSTLPQKTRFETIDFELFKLLGQHAAAALVSASLFEQAGRKLPGLEAFVDLSV